MKANGKPQWVMKANGETVTTEDRRIREAHSLHSSSLTTIMLRSITAAWISGAGLPETNNLQSLEEQNTLTRRSWT